MAINQSTVSAPIAETFTVERFGELAFGQEVHYATTTSSSPYSTSTIDAIPGIPAPGQKWSNEEPNLKVEEREIKVINVEGDNKRLRITSRYRLKRDDPSSKSLAIRGGSSLSQIRTQKTPGGAIISVKPPGGATDSVPITAEADVLVANQTMVREIYKETNAPQSVVSAWINKVNSNSFRGDPASNEGKGRWLCTDVTYELQNRVSDEPGYMFTFTFERSADPDGWLYFVAYRDASGKVPEGVDETDGSIVKLRWHEDKDFSELFM